MFGVPKSLSIYLAITGDQAVENIARTAVDETMRAMESEMQCKLPAMTDEQREKRRKAQLKRRRTPHGRAVYNEYMRKLMAARRAEKRRLLDKTADVPKSLKVEFPPIVNGRDPLLGMTPARNPWEPVRRDIYDEAREAIRAEQNTKPKIIRPDRPL